MSDRQAVWGGRDVLVTGHTGFKGGWLSLWLNSLGARVHGYALEPPTDPNLFQAARVDSILASDTRANVADLGRLRSVFSNTKPSVVFHLAAQPLVRESYNDPLGTFATNVMGTAHVLEAARAAESVRAIVVVTTDKVYLNHEQGQPYRETDPLGGHDPYSASKAAAEIVAASYRASFFDATKASGAHVATVRAGNVIGGGDWAVDRLIPDCLRAFATGEPVCLRFPDAVRPWQHVLEPLAGYLALAEELLGPDPARYASAWNFGPDKTGEATVREVALHTAQCWGKDAIVKTAEGAEHPHEAGLLRLDSTMARTIIGWSPRWSLLKAVESTVAWHQASLTGANMADVSLRQIREYEATTT